jgi:hypothetical protein
MKIEVFGGTDFPAPTSWRTASRGWGGGQSGSPGGTFSRAAGGRLTAALAAHNRAMRWRRDFGFRFRNLLQVHAAPPIRRSNGLVTAIAGLFITCV